MPADNLRRLLVESRDEERAAELEQQHAHDPASTDERLRQVDALLTSAPAIRAPRRLAASIMQHLAASLREQPEIAGLPEQVRATILQVLEAVMAQSMPLLVSAAWLVTHARRDPALLIQAIERISALLLMTVDALLVLLDEVERLIREDPEYAAIGAALIPSLLLGMLDYMSDDGRGAE